MKRSESLGGILLLLALVLAGNAQAIQFQPSGDVWVRELPGYEDTRYETDLMSVWSSDNNHSQDAGYRRYGLVSFDISSLSGSALQSATLQLYRFSNEAYPIRQYAYIIDTTVGTPLYLLTWNSYMDEYDDHKIGLSGLGYYNRGSGGGSTYLTSTATSLDLTLLESVANNTGKLSLVLIAQENGTDYRSDWGDNGYTNKPAP